LWEWLSSAVGRTGYNQALDRRRTKAAGFHEHLVKPIQIEHVAAVIANLSDPRRTQSGSGGMGG
jgi:CheY-like chemotaxis protein